MRVFTTAIALFVLITGFSAAFAQSARPERAAVAKLTREAIVGAWSLSGVDYSGPNGALADPIFGPNPQGLVIYEQSGWMSVQIVTANRPVMARPTARASRVATPDEAKLAAAAFDTYYAYFGTWDYNADTSVITHHINSSLLPYESGMEYRREVVLDGARLKLIARSEDMGEERHRTLVWTRISDPALMTSPSTASPVSAQVTSLTAGSAASLAHGESPLPVSAPHSGAPTRARDEDSKYGTMPADYQQAIKKYFLEHMKYPDSIQYQEITKPEQGYITSVTGGFFMREKRDYGWTVKVTINAKNSRGSYVGYKTYTFLFRGETIVDARLPLPGDEMNEPTRD